MRAYDIAIPEKKAKPLVSVIIPTHNRAGLLQEALDSVLAQKGVGEDFDMEVIVVDDASSDATREVVCGLPGVRYVRLTTNRGMSGARNAGIKASTGNYVAFLDDDDLMLPHRLGLQVPVMETHAEIGVVYSQNIIKGRGIEKIWPGARRSSSGDEFEKTWPDAQTAPSGDVFHIYLMREFISMNTPLVRRSAFDKAGCFDENLTNMEHYDMFLRLAFHVPFAFAEGNVAINRVNPQGVFHVRLAGEEGYARMLPKVVEKALDMLPDTAYRRRLRREVHAALVPRLFCMLERIEDITGKRSYARIAFETCPWILTEPLAREALVASAHYFVRNTTSPTGSVRAVSKEIRAAWKSRGLKDCLRMRLFMSKVWMGVAMSLGFRLNPCHGAAAYAAVRALLYSPLNVSPAFLKLMVRLIVGSRTYSHFAVLKRRIS